MGLCKCPHRKVTNIFCYEHRVNVCEHCLMHNHPKCVVDTYRNWITDSVFSPKCGLCEDELVHGETIRLLCFHIVHWECLNSWARSLPATTAPAGYTCPICKKMGLFPALNQVSPIADALREKMGEVNWARVGLGLPLLDNEVLQQKNSPYTDYSSQLQPNSPNGDYDKKSDVSENDNSFDGASFNRHSTSNAEVLVHSHSLSGSQNLNSGNPYSKLNQNYGNPPNSYYSDVSSTKVGASSSPVTNSRKSVKFDVDTPLFIDEDDHKYRRRSPFESLTRWLRTFVPAGNRRTSRRRTALYVVLTIICLLILIMLIFGRGDSDDDGFNPQSNPHVKVGHGIALGGIGEDGHETE